uniref:Integrase catalytic domain-containing protein n=1 Tax=Parastrongyloides trichosuri TaxID=131310 RepID=A0A0N5A066_PARTI
MDEDMKRKWKLCLQCLLNKEQPGKLVQIKKKFQDRPEEIWHTINADFMQVDNEYILVMVGEFSFPKIIRSDNGPAFASKIVAEYLKSVGIKQHFGSPHNHRGNAFVERFNRTLRETVRIHKGEPLNKTIAHFVYAYNRAKTKNGMSSATLLLNTADRFNNEPPIHNGYSGIHKLVKEVKREFNYRPL